VLKCDELLKPIEYAILVIDVWACSGDVIISQQRCRRLSQIHSEAGLPAVLERMVQIVERNVDVLCDRRQRQARIGAVFVSVI
jgi:hypothetical protein